MKDEREKAGRADGVTLESLKSLGSLLSLLSLWSLESLFVFSDKRQKTNDKRVGLLSLTSHYSLLNPKKGTER